MSDVQIQTIWQLNPLVPPVPVNQILLQEGAMTQSGRSGEMFLTFGHVTPPLFGGTMAEAAEEGIVLPIVPVGRFAITLDRLREFRDVIDAFIETMPKE